MKGEILLQNIVNLFVVSIILESAVMAVFNMSSLKNIKPSRVVDASRDVVILLLSLFVCLKVDVLRVFRGTGVSLPELLHIILSGLVLARMINFVKQLTERFRQD